MTMGWMETIHFIGLDLEVATVVAVASLDLAARALKRLASTRADDVGSIAVTQFAKPYAKNPYKENATRVRSTVLVGAAYLAAQRPIS